MAMTMMALMDRGIDTDSGSALKALCKASIAKCITALLCFAGKIGLFSTKQRHQIVTPSVSEYEMSKPNIACSTSVPEKNANNAKIRCSTPH
jgi:hypothetical protein